MESRDMVGMEARTPDGEGIGRISEIVLEDGTDIVTHAVVERDGEKFEVPVTSLTVDEDADFATFHADRSDEEPGDHIGDAESPQGYAPIEVEDGGADDAEDEGQFVTVPDEEDEEISPAELAREEWSDEEDTPDSGYPRNDVYVDPDSGEEVVEPELKDSENAGDDVADLISDTGLTVESFEDGIVVLGGSIASQRDLTDMLAEIMGISGILGTDSGDVEIEG